MGDDFRDLLRRFRDHKRWSQERCALECEMDHSLVSRLESGQRTPTRDSLAKLSAGLGLGREDADRLWLAAGFVPADLPPEELRDALALVRATTPGEIAAATALISAARGARA
jgi:transcriptional regulator with XRE-family HTH domain